MCRLLTDEQLGEAVLIATRISVEKNGWQNIAIRQDISTLKAVGEWLASITVSGNAEANEIQIVEGIVELKHGRMPKEIKKEVNRDGL